MNRHYFNWSHDDLIIVRAQYGIMPNQDLAALLRRSVKALQQFARRQGISAVENRYALLNAEYGTTPNDDLARRLNRSARAVREIARRYAIFPPQEAEAA